MKSMTEVHCHCLQHVGFMFMLQGALVQLAFEVAVNDIAQKVERGHNSRAETNKQTPVAGSCEVQLLEDNIEDFVYSNGCIPLSSVYEHHGIQEGSAKVLSQNKTRDTNDLIIAVKIKRFTVFDLFTMQCLEGQSVRADHNPPMNEN